MAGIKAIETTYKGYRFRSRLEARWAVFFDALQTFWEYEPQGFECDGLRYLPDFKLKGVFDLFVDVKPDPHQGRPNEKHKAFARYQPLLLLCGNPWPFEYMAWPLADQIVFPGTTIQFAQCWICKSTTLLISSFDGATSFGSVWTQKLPCHEGRHHFSWLWPGNSPHEPDLTADYHGLANAYKLARGARFEHGETPRV